MLRTLIMTTMILMLAVSCTDQVELSGIDKSHFDTSVRPQDDFFQYVNGKWVEETEMPADKSRYGTFDIMYDENQVRLKEIIEKAAEDTNAEQGSDAQKVGDFYNSFIDSLKIEELGLSPLQEELTRIDEVQSYDELSKLFAHHKKIGVTRPFDFYVHQDAKNSTEYILYFFQSGLGLPDRDYYFNEGEKFEEFRSKYIEYIAEILSLASIDNAESISNKVMEIETSMADKHWTRVESRNRDKTYNKYSIDQLSELTPKFNWHSFLTDAELTKADNVIVRQPSYMIALNDIISNYSVEDWKNYSKFKLISSFAPELPSAFVDASFKFYGKTLRGTEENRPRWKRAVSATNASMGEVLGKIYVEEYFKPEAKDRMVKLVDNLKLSMADRINKLEWMGDDTKVQALAKLEKFNAKIGYPNKWKDYSQLSVDPDELIQNTINSSIVEYNREINKLGKPIDREEWGMTPQMVNAYYSPTMNEVVFPAAILQPPFFNLKADDAVNYGGIGAVIGHEITHGFDDQGRKSDGDGNLVEWWTKEDENRFMERAQVVVDHYNEFVPIDTMHINGKLSLGENIADIGGLTVSYNAYKMSLNGEEPPVLNGFTGEQRVFIGWAQGWRAMYRDDALRNQIVRGPHSPAKYRVIGVMNNMPEFYAAFDVNEGDGHYFPEEKRAKIW